MSPATCSYQLYCVANKLLLSHTKKHIIQKEGFGPTRSTNLLGTVGVRSCADWSLQSLHEATRTFLEGGRGLQYGEEQEQRVESRLVLLVWLVVLRVLLLMLLVLLFMLLVVLLVIFVVLLVLLVVLLVILVVMLVFLLVLIMLSVVLIVLLVVLLAMLVVLLARFLLLLVVLIVKLLGLVVLMVFLMVSLVMLVVLLSPVLGLGLGQGLNWKGAVQLGLGMGERLLSGKKTEV